MVSRRTFLAVAGASAAGLVTGARSAAAADARERLGRIGVQLFSLPKLLEQDLDGTLAMLAKLGFQEVELFGPYPFSPAPVQAQWKGMSGQLGFSGSGYFGLTAAQFRQRLDAHGLTAPSMHVDLDTLRDRLEPLGEAAQALGHRYCGIASIPAERRRTLDDYKRMADELNALGAKARPYGFKVLYHNHGYGLTPVNGEVPLRAVLDRLDPSVTATEMDLFWTVAGGGDPVALLDAYPKHYRLMHVKDMSKLARLPGDDMGAMMSLFPLMRPAGAGVLELPRILAHAKKNGVEHFFVEQDLASSPAEQLGASIRYLRGLTLQA